ncbi:hypothetical protein J6W34_03280 [bacterium]|nr:hypothetical protein [bacterium]
MYKIIFMLILQALLIAGYYYFNSMIFLILNQLLIALYITLTDNAVSVNYNNINALNTNIENLIKHIAVFQNKIKNESLEDKWFDVDDEK